MMKGQHRHVSPQRLHRYANRGFGQVLTVSSREAGREVPAGYLQIPCKAARLARSAPAQTAARSAEQAAAACRKPS